MNPDKERGELAPGVPAVFGDGEIEMRDRRALADWLVDEENPLTARVTINQI